MTRSIRNTLGTTNASTVAAPPPEAVTVESDFVVILAALLCALICVVGLIAVARCAWLRRGSGISGGGSGSRSPTRGLANKGLKKKVLQSLPKYTYGSTKLGVVGGGAECAICLGDFGDGDQIRVLPHCGHAFHVACIDTWLASHSSCPSCRQILVLARCNKCGHFPANISAPTAPPPPPPPPHLNFNAAATTSSSFINHNIPTFLPWQTNGHFFFSYFN